ncbi:hypothetical protein FHR99_000148 [Litorivivens lipolytica]|uniref:Uncharacterized protein n=1 Tax=Litorivivens lipolytica TaxID=1524264 RepID=A0A7W4W2X5_9GAMM|nr:hypothetical protein [Litorivivens lipolytica]MBB3045912.1 hypothetical protein [Litorivivens lipolytica]
MENSLDVMSAAAKDIWVDDGKGKRLANMHQSVMDGTYQIQDPSLRRLAETRLELEKQNREIQRQVQAYNAEQKRKQQAQRREMAQRQAEYRAQQQAYQQRQQEVAQARANEQRRLAEARQRAEQERRAQLAREAAERDRLAEEERERQIAERKRIAAERAAAAMRPKPQTGRIRQGRMHVVDKADCDCKGTLTKRNLKVGSCEVASLTVAYDVTHFLGEPLVKGDYKWQAPAGGAKDCLPSSLSLWLKIQNREAFGYVEINPVVPRAGSVSYSGTADSPNWDSFICGYEGDDETQCFDKETAKTLYKKGRISDFELSHR